MEKKRSHTSAPENSNSAAPKNFGSAADGDVLAKQQVERVRMEHRRTIDEERNQNYCLCGLLVLSIIVVLALLTVAFYDRTTWSESPNLTYFVEITGSSTTNVINTKAPLNYSERRLKNLTESCASKIEPYGCFYHKNIYPDSCIATNCSSIIFNIYLDNAIRDVAWQYTRDTASMGVEDWTPCAPGKLCISGTCVEHPDALQYVVPKAHPGGVRVMCNSSTTCVKIAGRLVENEFAQSFMTCKGRSCDRSVLPPYVLGNEFAVRFLSCSNPYPVEMDPGCFPQLPQLASEYMPFVMYEFCLKCSDLFINDVACSSMPEDGAKFGIPCRSGLSRIKTFCAGAHACVPLYKEYPETYSIRPIQRC